MCQWWGFAASRGHTLTCTLFTQRSGEVYTLNQCFSVITAEPRWTQSCRWCKSSHVLPCLQKMQQLQKKQRFMDQKVKAHTNTFKSSRIQHHSYTSHISTRAAGVAGATMETQVFCGGDKSFTLSKLLTILHSCSLIQITPLPPASVASSRGH
jgi:hypothetical protein